MCIRDSLMAMSVQKYAEEQTDRRWRSRFLIYLGDIIMISQLSDKEEMLEYTNDLDRLCRMGNRVLNVRITAGIGYLCNNLEQIPLLSLIHICHWCADGRKGFWSSGSGCGSLADSPGRT